MSTSIKNTGVKNFSMERAQASHAAMIKALERLVDFEVIDEIEDRGDSVMIETMAGHAHVIAIESVPAWLDGFLTGLRAEGIFPDERERLLTWLDGARV